MTAIVPQLEARIEKIGFARRDFGVAVAFAVLYHHETATGTIVPDAAAQRAARSIVAAVGGRYGALHNALSPAVRERVYETLLCEAIILNTFAKTFTDAGKSAEADLCRQNAARLFTRLTGKSAGEVSFTGDGRIVGLGGGGSTSKIGDRTVAAVPTAPPPGAASARANFVLRAWHCITRRAGALAAGRRWSSRLISSSSMGASRAHRARI